MTYYYRTNCKKCGAEIEPTNQSDICHQCQGKEWADKQIEKFKNSLKRKLDD